MMSCFLHAVDALPSDPNFSSICAPYSKSNIGPGFCLEFRALERDYMGLDLGLKQQPADQKNIPFPNDDLCGSHLKLAPPPHGADDREGDADDGGEEHLSANVGWPPISSYRRSTTRGLSMKPPCNTETMTPLIVHEAPLEDSAYACNGCVSSDDSCWTGDQDHENELHTLTCTIMPKQSSLLIRNRPSHIKVSMDGTPIMRKLNLQSMQGYHHLSLELHKLFKFYTSNYLSCEVGGQYSCFKDLKGARFLLTYKDRDGDWMLVGDTPWETFARSARRIRIMKRVK